MSLIHVQENLGPSLLLFHYQLWRHYTVFSLPIWVRITCLRWPRWLKFVFELFILWETILTSSICHAICNVPLMFQFLQCTLLIYHSICSFSPPLRCSINSYDKHVTWRKCPFSVIFSQLSCYRYPNPPFFSSLLYSKGKENHKILFTSFTLFMIL